MGVYFSSSATRVAIIGFRELKSKGVCLAAPRSRARESGLGRKNWCDLRWSFISDSLLLILAPVAEPP